MWCVPVKRVEFAELAAQMSTAWGASVAYAPVPVEVFKTFGFPGAAELGNMFAFFQRPEFKRSLEDTKALIPHLTPASAVFAAAAERERHGGADGGHGASA